MTVTTTATDPLPTIRTRTQTAGGITRWVSTAVEPTTEPLSMRTAMGTVLREHRINQGLKLRELSALAMISLGYLSEVERGKKEASSEILSDLCAALTVSLAGLLREVAERLEPTTVPDTIEILTQTTNQQA